MTSSSNHGLVALFKKPADLIKAAEAVRQKNITHFDCFTPYPIHGLDKAMGLVRSWIPRATLAFGIFGCCAGFGMQYWMSAVDWPLNIGGKPFNSWPAFIPITFECTILFAGLATIAALLYACRLPNLKPIVLDPEITSHSFALFIEARDRHYDEKILGTLFKSLGAYEVRVLDEKV